MLPPRSKRIAGSAEPVPRLRLVTTWQLGVSVLLLIMLFALIFPRRSLLEALHQQEHFDDLTLAYIDNLKRVSSTDPDLTLLVTRARLDQLSHAQVESTLRPLIKGGDERLRNLAGHTLATASLREMGRLLAEYHGEDAVLARLRDLHLRIRILGDARSREAARPLWLETLLRTPGPRLRAETALQAQVQELLTAYDPDGLALSDRMTLASLALHAGRDTDAERMLAGVADEALRSALPGAARKALAQGHYDTAARLYLLARERATTLAEARELFRQGIAALMAGELHAAAMQAAERHLGNLGNDVATLRFLTRTALAAGDPRRAAEYARRLVFLPAEKGRQ